MGQHSRILITNNHLRRIGGSEIVVLELAEEFLNRGWKVDVFSPDLGHPMTGEFGKLPGIERMRLTSDVGFPFEDKYDLIWIHHSAIPTAVLESFVGENRVHTAIIWGHLSALENVYMEQPLQVQLERALADVVVAVSEETRTWITRFGLDRDQTLLFENPAPDRFADTPVVLGPEHLGKILCVSCHPPSEVMEGREMLLQSGHECDMLGQAKVRRLEPETLRQYDAVVTIGKTVQYALCMGIPCYIYDHFGGDGWLDESNFDSNAAYNFSGRNTGRRIEAATLFKEVTERFGDACRFAQSNRERHAKYYRLSRRIDALLRSPVIQHPKIKQLNASQCMQLRQYAAFVQHTHAAIIALNAELSQTKAMLSKLAKTLEKERLHQRKLCADMEKFVDRWNGRSWMEKLFKRMQLPEKYRMKEAKGPL